MRLIRDFRPLAYFLFHLLTLTLTFLLSPFYLLVLYIL